VSAPEHVRAIVHELRPVEPQAHASPHVPQQLERWACFLKGHAALGAKDKPNLSPALFLERISVSQQLVNEIRIGKWLFVKRDRYLEHVEIRPDVGYKEVERLEQYG
jgi:hypothetical protein